MITDSQLQILIESCRRREPICVEGEILIHDALEELRKRRETDRTVWKNAPEWANFITTDDDGSQTYYECKPEPVLAGWWYAEKGRTESFLVRDWKSTLQERQKRGHYDQAIIDDIPFEERPK